MRKIFRFRTLLLLAIIGTIVGVIVTRRSAQVTPPYPDPWAAPVAPPFPTGEPVEAMGTNGRAAPVADIESLDH